jgi:DNA invertase Pin-like site-specific DNA recombinase
LGPWLTDPEKIAQWDVLIIAKIDRLTRSLSDFDDLVKWCDNNGKTLFSIDDTLDLSNSAGRMSANLLAMFAQFERERMSERRQEAAVKIRENGWWAGFGIPYGARPVKVENHWELEINPETYARLEQIAWEIIRGYSRSSIAKRLNATQVPTPAGGKEWRQNTIADIFTNEKCVLEPDLLERVLEALDSTKQAWTKRGDAAMLLNVASCYCGAEFYAKRYTSKGHLYEYYDCSAKCGAKRVPMALVESAVEAFMIDRAKSIGFANHPIYRKKTQHGKSSKAELIKTERKLHTLDYDAPDWRETQDKLLAQRKHLLISAEREPARTTYEQVPNLTVGDYWPTLDKHGKRQLLLEAGIKVTDVKRRDAWKAGADVTVTPPEDVRFVLLETGGLEIVDMIKLRDSMKPTASKL